MPANDIAKDLAQKAGKSIAQQALESITPDVFVNLYHKLTKSKISLTNDAEIAGFHCLIKGLASFCDPSQPLSVCPEIAACWEIFTYTQINASTYQFAHPFKFSTLSEPYERHETIQGRTYWDYPFTSSILSLVAAAPALKDHAKQSLIRLAFGYISSIAVTIASLDTENKKYEAIQHLNQVVNVLINEESCRKLFDEPNTQALVQISNRITQFFSFKHAEREAAFIPEAVHALKCLSREMASQLFAILFIASEGNAQKRLTFDYERIARNIINPDLKNPVFFNPSNPFALMLKESSKLLNALHDEPCRDDILKTLEVPELAYIQRYIKNNLVLALEDNHKWFPNRAYSLLYFFMQKVDPNTQASVWMAETDLQVLAQNAQQLAIIAQWLKYYLTIASVAKDLSLLLSMEGQKWLAQGQDALIIQQFIYKIHVDIAAFKKDITDFHHFLRGRLRAKCGREHHLFARVSKLDNTHLLLMKKGVMPLMNIEEKYLVTAEYIHEIRHQFFARIISVLHNSSLGFNFTMTEPLRAANTPPSSSLHDMISSTYHAGPRPDQFLKVDLTQKLSHWIEEAFNSKDQQIFLSFWRLLLYVENDHGLFKGSKLPKLQQFHQRYRRDIQKIEAQQKLSEELLDLLGSPKTAVYHWAHDFLILVYKNSLAQDTFLGKKIKDLAQKLGLKNKASRKHLCKKLGIRFPEESAWESKVYTSLLKTLKTHLGLTQKTAEHFLVDVSHSLLQHDVKHDVARSEALDALLNTALNNLLIYADKPEQHGYWHIICRGLMMLGANPLVWMDRRMQHKTLVEQEDSPAFYVACQQATLILSSLTCRARFLAETSLHLQGKFDRLITAVEAFGLRLYACVADDQSWWWLAFNKILPSPGGARLERATLFWAVIHWLYVSINEQMLEADANPTQTKNCFQSLETLDAANQQYQKAVPAKDKRYNQGFETWHRLDIALKDYRYHLSTLISLRRQKETAIALDLKKQEALQAEKQAETARQERLQAEANLQALEDKQQASLMRHLVKSLLAHLQTSKPTEALTGLVEDIADIHLVDPSTVQNKLNVLVLTDDRFLSLRVAAKRMRFFDAASNQEDVRTVPARRTGVHL